MTRGRKPSANAPARRAEILHAATAVFIERGYSGATTLEIARRAGASKTTIYMLFGSKEGLLEELFQERLRSIPLGLDPDAAAESPDQYEFVRLSAERILSAAAAPETVALHRIALAEMMRFPELTPIMIRARAHEGLTAYLARCREKGWMAFDDAEEAATMFISMATGDWVDLMLIGALAHIPASAVKAHAALTARMFLAAVAPRPVSGLNLRALCVEDAAAAAAVVRAAFAAQSCTTDPPSGALRETTASVAAKLAEGGGAGAEAAGALVGVVLWAEQDGALYIGRVSVAPGWRGRGIARALLAAGEAEARRRGLARMTLRVRLALKENQRLFAGFGFTPAGQGAHPGYSEPTFLTMEKRLA
jgi:AcrR family transcriptional regulator/L-amino acid N-acyltransferase YncA